MEIKLNKNREPEKQPVSNSDGSKDKGYTSEELQRAHDEAYKKGFGDGFDKANELAVEGDENYGEDEPEE